MRTRKQELVSDDLKPFVCGIIKDYREKYNYSLEDLANIRKIIIECHNIYKKSFHYI